MASIEDTANETNEIDSKLRNEILIHGSDSVSAGELYRCLGYLKFFQGSFKEARTNFSKALEILRPALSDDNEDIIDLHYILAKLTGLQFDFF